MNYTWYSSFGDDSYKQVDVVELFGDIRGKAHMTHSKRGAVLAVAKGQNMGLILLRISCNFC